MRSSSSRVSLLHFVDGPIKNSLAPSSFLERRRCSWDFSSLLISSFSGQRYLELSASFTLGTPFSENSPLWELSLFIFIDWPNVTVLSKFSLSHQIMGKHINTHIRARASIPAHAGVRVGAPACTLCFRGKPEIFLCPLN